MKSLYRNYAFRLAAAVLTAGIALSGCTKENKIDQPGIGEGTKLTVKVLGITEKEGISSPQLKMSSAKGAQMNQSEATAPEVLTFDAFDAAVSLERDVLKKSKVSIGSASAGSSGQELMAASMEAGVKYRLLLYKTDGTFVSSTSLISGTTGEISVPVGQEYNWYAVSYNSTEEVADVNPVTASLVLPENTDVLYASGTVDVPVPADPEEPQNIPLGVVFEHKVARIGVELNTMGMFANMVSAKVIVSGAAVKKGTLNLLSGAMTDLVAYTPTLDYDDFTDVEAPYKDRKVAYLYTAEAAAVSNLRVTLTGLVLELDDNTTRNFNNSLILGPSTFTFNVTPVLGHSYRALVNLIESPLEVDGVRWARNNVYYVGGHNPYRFHHTYKHTNERNTYFSFKGEVPTSYGVDGDPCALVYPEGVWRTPGESHYRTLTGTRVLGLGPKLGGTPSTYGSVAGAGGALGYFEYDASGTAAPYPGNKLRFNMNGGSIGIALVEDLIELDLGSTYGNSVQYWSSSQLINLGGIIEVGGWSYNGAGTANNGDRLDLALLQISALGLAVVESEFKNVRCIRN